MQNLYQQLTSHASKLFGELTVASGRKIYNVSLPHFALLLLFDPNSFIVIEDSIESASALY